MYGLQTVMTIFHPYTKQKRFFFGEDNSHIRIMRRSFISIATNSSVPAFKLLNCYRFTFRIYLRILYSKIFDCSILNGRRTVSFYNTIEKRLSLCCLWMCWDKAPDIISGQEHMNGARTYGLYGNLFSGIYFSLRLIR